MAFTTFSKKEDEKVYSFKVSTFINSNPTTVFKAITDLRLLNLFFPMYSFESDKESLEKVGQEYTAKIDSFIVEKYKIVKLTKNSLLSAKLISDSKIFKHLAYVHKILPVKGGVVSKEVVEYSVRYGLLGKFLNFLIIAPLMKYHVKKAHKRLKRYCER